MPKQISKSATYVLFDEEVEAWNAFEKYAVSKNMVVWSRIGSQSVSSQRVLRVILQLAAEHLAADIGPELAEKLAIPRPYPRPYSRPIARTVTRASASKTVTKASKLKAGKKGKKEKEPVPTHRIAWNRPWKSRGGNAG
mgnify:CR=1 FL=1